MLTKFIKIHEGTQKKSCQEDGSWVNGCFVFKGWVNGCDTHRDDECLLVPCRSRSLKDQWATASLGSWTTNGRISRTFDFFLGVAESCFWVCFMWILFFTWFLMNECHICHLIYNLLDIIVIFVVIYLLSFNCNPKWWLGHSSKPRHIVFLRRSAGIRVQTLSSSIVVCITHVALPTPCNGNVGDVGKTRDFRSILNH